MNNPVLRGFNPDPTMCYAQGKYYIATSTFQWYPGITIYESSDLVNFEIVGRPLVEEMGFNLQGIDDSAGIWAPNLIFENDQFYLSYTIVKSITGVYYDMENYIITSSQIDGPWSKPAKVNSGCFDPSLFFDQGQLYLLGKIVDHRFEPSNQYIDNYSGIIIQKLDNDTFELIDDFQILTHGTGLGGEEGPQLFKRNGYYYLNIAEGGTEYGHQTTVLRAESIFGPYEVHPQNPVLKSDSNSYLQKAGHSSFVVNEDDFWVISHLCSRPIVSTAPEISGKKCCPLGRETAIQEIEWKDDWPYVVDGPAPSSKFRSELKRKADAELNYSADSFPDNKFLQLRSDNGLNNRLENNKLIMPGKDSLMSKFDVNLYAHRVDKFNFTTSLTLEYDPSNYLQMSGLTLYYDTENYITIFVTHDQKFGRCVKVETLNHRKYSTLNVVPIPVASGPVTLKMNVANDQISLSYEQLGFEHQIDCKYYTSFLSDDYILVNKPAFFTGMMCGFYSSDLSGKQLESAIINYKYNV